MRIRQVKPAFWSDARIAELPDAVRLFYIGLWMEADDAGWFRWDPVEVARDLYGFEGRARRERRVAAMFQALCEAGRITLHPCGHAEVPTLTTHQRLAGPEKQVKTALTEHARVCNAPPRVPPQVPADPRHGTVREGRGNGKGDGHGEGKVMDGYAPAGALGQKATDEGERRAALEQASADFRAGRLTELEYTRIRKELAA